MTKEQTDPDSPSHEVLAWITDVGEQPYPRQPEQGIADMRQHLALLRDDLQFWLDVQDEAEEDDDAVGADTAQWMLAEIRKGIAECQARMAEYEAQLKGRN